MGNKGRPMDHKQLIEKLGGGAILAKRLKTAGIEVDAEAIYKWREFNRVPLKWRSVIASVARIDGIPLPKDFLPGFAALNVPRRVDAGR